VPRKDLIQKFWPSHCCCIDSSSAASILAALSGADGRNAPSICCAMLARDGEPETVSARGVTAGGVAARNPTAKGYVRGADAGGLQSDEAQDRVVRKTWEPEERKRSPRDQGSSRMAGLRP
jgi:hypothetical protein